MTTRRARTLQAAGEAARIQARFPPDPRTSFDIVRAIATLGFPILFRPTKDLLGATISVGEDSRGILVTTKRGLAIQRFTLAHELGHIVLGHKMHFDLVIEEDNRLVAGGISRQEENAANEFASGLLASHHLIATIAKKRKWDVSRVGDPATIYQLSLRLGVSFQAACWALAGNNMLSADSAKRIADETEVNALKTAIISPYTLQDPWADVWTITEGDIGCLLEGGPNDIFAVNVRDKSSAGFLWELETPDQDFEVISEKTDIGRSYGSDSSRVLLLRARSPGRHQISLEHVRPWSGERLSRIEVSIVNFGKEVDGLPRSVKHEMLLAH